MLKALSTFAALSMAGTVILSLLPEGGVKRTAGMVVSLLTLLCWAEGIASLLGFSISLTPPQTALAPTAVSVEQAYGEASAALAERWEASP